MTAATQLSIYNGALRICKDRKIASLSVNEERRYVLDDIWADGFIDACLEKGWWKHAMRFATLTQDSLLAPSIGYTYGFSFPSDLVKIYMVSADDRFGTPELDYTTQQRYLYANTSPLYVRYVSNDAAFGAAYALWPESFREFVHHELALRAIGRLVDSKAKSDDVRADHKTALLTARSNDALKEPSRFPPMAAWNQARAGSISTRGKGPDR